MTQVGDAAQGADARIVDNVHSETSRRGMSWQAKACIIAAISGVAIAGLSAYLNAYGRGDCAVPIIDTSYDIMNYFSPRDMCHSPDFTPAGIAGYLNAAMGILKNSFSQNLHAYPYRETWTSCFVTAVIQGY